MNIRMIMGKTLPLTYHGALCELYYCGEDIPCPDWNTSRKETKMIMVVEEPFREPMISKLFPAGADELQQYCMEMIDGILDFEIEKGNWKYTYHARMKDQIPFIIDELQRNPYSTKAVIDIRTPEDIGSNDPACLQHIQYFIRDGKLECDVLFRSNDAVKATFMNAFALIMLQSVIADKLGVGIGQYVHTANSFHAYERDIPTLKSYVEKIRSTKPTELCYYFKGDWQDLMMEATESIMAKVEELKTH